MKKIILFLIFSILTFKILAQTITGHIIDSQNQSVAYANIIALNVGDSSFVQGATTKEDGSFSIIVPENKTYLLKISSIEYETVYKETATGNARIIVLKEKNHQLSEVIVKGYRPIIKHEENKTIFDINQMPKIENLTSKDVLKFAPGVIINSNGDIKMAGKKATVFVNGRQLSLAMLE